MSNYPQFPPCPHCSSRECAFVCRMTGKTRIPWVPDKHEPIDMVKLAAQLLGYGK